MDAEMFFAETCPTAAAWANATRRTKEAMLSVLVLADCTTEQFIQDRPYTALEILFDTGIPGLGTLSGSGFSKVCVPDVYDPVYGEWLARKRACRKIIKIILRQEQGFQLLVRRWDDYRDGVEDRLAAARSRQAHAEGATEPWDKAMKARIEAEAQDDEDDVGVDEAGVLLVYTAPDLDDDGDPVEAEIPF